MKTKFKPGDLFENCFYHPVRCTEVDYKEDHISGESLITGLLMSCSIRHCGVVHITKEEADKAVEAFKEDGERGLLRLKGWPEDRINEFMSNWR